MRAIIVEDEMLARDLIKHYLHMDKEIELIGEYADGFSGAIAINRDKPDLVFLDIQLPKLNGFELIELLDRLPQIIFTTAYDEFAIKAFELNATDYLLKPFSQDRFLKALSKAKEQWASKVQDAELPHEGIMAMAQSAPINRVVVKDSKRIHIIANSDIYYIEAQDDYLFIHSTQGRFMKKQTMKSMEDRLSHQHFVRVHRSFIVNVLQIERLEPYEKDSYVAILKNEKRIRVSAAGYKLLKAKLRF